MSKKLFLDDERIPNDCVEFPWVNFKDRYLYKDVDWIVVRSYKEFVSYIQKNHIPSLISFDHDLGSNKTGMDCAKYLKQYIDANELETPVILVHSANPIGRQNILNLF